jgi:hypothetical protein
MKKYILHCIKLTLALVLLLQVGKVSAQSFVSWTAASGANTLSGTYTGGTVSLSQSTTGANNSLGSPGLTTAGFAGMSQTGATSFRSTKGGSTFFIIPKDMILTFSTPVKITKLNVGGLDSPESYHDEVQFSGVSFSGFTGSAFATVTSTGVQPLVGRSNQFGNFTNSNTAVSSFTIRQVPRDGLYSAVTYYEIEVVACKAGTTAPTLSGTTLTAACPANTVNLTSLVTGTTPAGTSVKWFTNVARTTEVTTPTAVGLSGTYFAFFYDATADCFSPASAAVTVTANCPLNVATTCPAVSFDLSSRITTTPATGYTYTYHTGTPATEINMITDPVVTTAGTYYIGTYFAGQDCYTNTSRPIAVTITDCCATLTPPIFNN